MRKSNTVRVVSRTPDENDRFLVMVDGYAVPWTIEQIKRHVAEGGDLTERERATQ